MSWDRAFRAMLAIGGPTFLGIYAGNPAFGLIAAVCALWVWLSDFGGAVTDRLSDMTATMTAIILGGVIGGLIGTRYWPELIGLFLAALAIGWLHNTSRAVENAGRCLGFTYVIAASLALNDPHLILAALGGGLWAMLVVCGDQMVRRHPTPVTGTCFRLGLTKLKAGHAADWRFGVRYALAAAIGLSLAEHFGASHAAWATITSLAVMRPNAAESVTLVIERGIGTFAGVVIAWGILALTSNVWLLGALVAAFAFSIAPAALWHRWARFTAVTVTVLVLLDVALINQGGDRPLLAERLYDTAMGCVIALVATWLVFPQRRSSTQPI